MSTRDVHLKLDQELWNKARQAAAADRRSLSNWVTILIEQALQRPSRDEYIQRMLADVGRRRDEVEHHKAEPPAP